MGNSHPTIGELKMKIRQDELIMKFLVEEERDIFNRIIVTQIRLKENECELWKRFKEGPGCCYTKK